MQQHGFAVMGSGRTGLHGRKLRQQRFGLGLSHGRAQGLMRVYRRVNTTSICFRTQKIVRLALFKGIKIRHGHLFNTAKAAVSIYDIISGIEQ